MGGGRSPQLAVIVSLMPGTSNVILTSLVHTFFRHNNSKSTGDEPAVLLLRLENDEDQRTKTEPCREGKLLYPGVTAQLRTIAKKKKAKHVWSACGWLMVGRRAVLN